MASMYLVKFMIIDMVANKEVVKCTVKQCLICATSIRVW